MSKLKACKHCEHFNPNDTVIEAGSRGPVMGICLRYPPVPMIMQQNQIAIAGPAVGMAGVNPPVNSEHSCGEWQRHPSVRDQLLDAKQSTESSRTGAANDHD